LAGSPHTNEAHVFIVLQTFHQSDLGQKGYLSRQDAKAATLALLGYKPLKVW